MFPWKILGEFRLTNSPSVVDPFRLFEGEKLTWYEASELTFIDDYKQNYDTFAYNPTIIC